MLIPMPFTQAVITLFTSKQRCFLFNGSMTIPLAGDGFALFLTTAPSPSVAKLTISAYSGTSSKPKSLLPDQHLLRFLDDVAALITCKPILGLSKAFLIGDISDLSAFPAFQLPLPFSWDQQQMARLYETIP
ncbi:MAG: hypothetical protein R2867_18055 [Caldilineaceae bacterium]